MRSLYKIIHTTCHTSWGGLEKRIFNEAVWMDKQGHRITLVAPENTPLFQRAKAHGFRVYAISFSRTGLISDYRALVRIFNNELPDIVNTHGNTDAKIALPAAKKAGIPCRILSRHISAHVRNSWYNRRLYKYLSHYVFTTADYTTRYLQTMFKLKGTQIFSIPSGILAPETLIPRDEARKNLAIELGCGPETRFVGFVGRLSRDKGVTTLLQAFRQIQSRINHHLVLVGNGPDEYRNQLMEMAQKLGICDRTHFIGFKDDVWPFYRALDCKILASENINGIPFEGVPQALLEAMYCSCPVIGSKTGGIPDIIQHGITGLLFDPKDAATLAKLLVETLHREAATLERVYTARKKVRQFHTIDAMGRDIIRIYRLHQIKLGKR
ncbi:MAG: glycosyltransferase [Desulfotignum sp.]|nr:glycosyltransferase [Desulfotignum sp.]MCF8124707.1 glycosyltransferase [Desulfotignum sp.]